MMRRRFLHKNAVYGLLIISTLCLAVIAFYVYRDRTFDFPPNIANKHRSEDWPKLTKIGVIGDSWAAHNHLDQPIKIAMEKLGFPVEVVSSGHPGATSRQIYRNLLADQSVFYSSRKILLDLDLDYLVVIGGVNDTARYMGRDFYAHHMTCIVKMIQNRGIHPVIIEVPEYGIEDIPHNLLYCAMFDGMQINVIPSYREALKINLSNSVNDELTLVSFDPFIKDYSENHNLYRNPLHLNKDGLKLFAAYIAEEIVKSHTARMNLLTIAKQ